MTPTVAIGDPGKGGVVSETATPTLTAQVGGACGIVHVLEWKEGMAILPSSNLKVSDGGVRDTKRKRITVKYTICPVAAQRASRPARSPHRVVIKELYGSASWLIWQRRIDLFPPTAAKQQITVQTSTR